MSKRKVCYNASMTNRLDRLALLIFILGGITLVALSIRITNDTKGSAYIINRIEIT